jgi:outer membrane receptor for ferrienterochelin and colicins
MYRLNSVFYALITLYLVCLVGFSARGQAVNGLVVNAFSGEPIEGVLIENPDDRSEATITDSLGKFQLETSSKQLIFSHVAYLETVIDVHSSYLYVELEPHEDVLNVAVVSEGKTSKKLALSTVSVEKVSPRLITDKIPLSIDETINQVPGVVVTDQQINIRGGAGWSYGAGSRVMVLMDGTPLASGDAGQVLWSFINLENIKRMEVVKGASSVVYGSSALNGVISLESDWAKPEPKTAINTFFGVYDKAPRAGLNWNESALMTYGLRAYHSRQLGKSDVIASIDILQDDGYRFSDHDRRNNFGLSYRYRGDKNWIAGVRTNFMTSESGSFLLWNSLDSGYSALNNAATTNEVLRYRVDPFFTWYANSNSTHKLKTRYLRVNNQVDNGDTSVDQSNSSHVYYAEYQHVYSWETLKLASGAVLNSASTQSPLFGGSQNAQNLAAYTQVDYQGKKLGASLGFRYEYYKLNDYVESKPVFRSGLNYKVSPYTFLRASWGQGYRFPTIAESYISTNVGLLNIFPNPDLQSETGWNAEIGVKQGLEFLGLKAFVDLALYRMEYNNMMEFIFAQWRPDFFTGIGFKSVNMGRTRIDGFEISTTGQYKKNLHSIRFLMGYNFNLPQSMEPDKVVAYDSSRFQNPLTYNNTSSDTSNFILKYRNQHVVKVDISYTYKRVDVGFSFRYQSAIQNHDIGFMEGPITLELSGIREGAANVGPGTSFVDFRFFYKLSSRIRLGLIVNNAMNTVEMGRPADFNAPRMFMLQLKSEF